MALRQKYGIKYPFNSNDIDGSFLDLNQTEADKIKSELLHIILTPKGQRLRDPNFGTNLTRFIFEPNDEITYDKIREEITNQVMRYLPGVEFIDFSFYTREEEETEIIVAIDYSVKTNNNEKEITTIVVKL
jgi:phage baseplate assembly protein W